MKKILFFIYCLIYFPSVSQILPEANNADNIIFKEYVNSSNVLEIYPEYSPNGSSNYAKSIDKALEFNKDYDKDKFSIFVFHGRYYIDVEQILIPKKGWSTKEKDEAILKGRLNVLKEKYKVDKHAELGAYFIQELRNRLETAIKSKVGNNHRFIVLCATQVHFLSYKSFEASKNNPSTGEKSYYNYFFWHTSNLGVEEKKNKE